MKYYKEVKTSNELPKIEGFYHTNRGWLWFNPKEEGGVFCDESGFCIYSKDKVKTWLKEVTIEEMMPGEKEERCNCGLTHETCDCIDTGICSECGQPI